MATPKIDLIKAVLGFSGVSDADLVSRCNAVHDGMTNNPAYPTHRSICRASRRLSMHMPPQSPARSQGKAALATRDKQRGAMIEMLRQLGHYVEIACKKDMETFISSGFVAVSKTRAPEQPVDPPAIASVDQRLTGQLAVTIKNVPKARHYELRSGAVPVGGGAISWTSMLVPTTKPPTVINNLTPGRTYTFQVRAYGNWATPIGAIR